MNRLPKLSGLLLSLLLTATPHVAIAAPSLEQLFKQGEAAQEAKQYLEAERIWRQVIQQQPSDADAHLNLGDALYDQKQFNQAVAAYRQAIQLNPKLINAYTSLGAVLRDQGRLAEAIATHRQVLKIDPQNATAYNNLGVALADQNQAEEAIAAFRQSLKLNPKDAIVHTNLADTLEADKQIDAAIASYRQAIQLNPKNGTAYNNLANLFYRQKQLDEAMAAFRKSVEVEPQEATGHYGIGIILHDQGKLEEAIVNYRKAIALDPLLIRPYEELGNALQDSEKSPSNAADYYGLGLLLSREGKTTQAIAAYRRAIALNPKLALAYKSLGDALLQNGPTALKSTEEAVVAYRQAVTLAPNYRPFYTDLSAIANQFQDFGNDQAAIAVYQLLLQMVPDDPATYVGLGRTYRQQGKLEIAVKQYRRAIELNQNYAEAHLELANLLSMDLQRWSEAEAAYRQAITLEADSNYFDVAINGFEESLRRQNKLETAIAFYRELLKRYPESVPLHRYLGDVLAEQKQFAAATPLYRRLIKLQRTTQASPDQIASSYEKLDRILVLQDQVDAAFALYQEAIQLDPSNFQVLHHFAELQKSQNRRSEAVATYRQMIALAPTEILPRLWLGEILRLEQQFTEAIAVYEAALKVAKDSYSKAIAHDGLGLIFEQQGNLTAAIRQFQQALQIFPGASEVQRHLQAAEQRLKQK
ncbi:tetratricopeptide repeat protein [Trichocoleus desertorum AS-A10]|uniref:tetratricopeptide repeat protein n=1 Tax=Trichocoleus desertorum TaxID=1481672 RepID=UPI0032998100